jgi:hypothetical protein
VINTPTAEQLYDLGLIGLTWFRRDNPSEPGRLGASVIRVLANASAISGSARANVATNPALITLAMKNMEINSGYRPGLPVLRRYIQSSQVHLLTWVTTRPIVYAKLFGAGGYGLVITNAGME